MKLLAFDTSTIYTAIALFENDTLIFDTVFLVGTRHSVKLLTNIEQALQSVGWKFNELNAIAVGTGPGLFTGLRVGIATAQGLAYAHGCPLYGVSSMEAHALSAPNDVPLVAITKDARKKELYVALYRYSQSSTETPSYPQPVGPTRLLRPDIFAQELAQLDEPVMLLGNGVEIYHSTFKEILGEKMRLPPLPKAHLLHASGIAQLALQQAKQDAPPQIWEVQPLYIRPSEAELKIGPPEGGAPLEGRILPDGTVLPEMNKH